MEREFLHKVHAGDVAAVSALLSLYGKPLIWSEWAGGVCKTSILYAANKPDVELCKVLLRYGGMELMKVKDIKHRDLEYF